MLTLKKLTPFDAAGDMLKSSVLGVTSFLFNWTQSSLCRNGPISRLFLGKKSAVIVQDRGYLNNITSWRLTKAWPKNLKGKPGKWKVPRGLWKASSNLSLGIENAVCIFGTGACQEEIREAPHLSPLPNPEALCEQETNPKQTATGALNAWPTDARGPSTKAERTLS